VGSLEEFRFDDDGYETVARTIDPLERTDTTRTVIDLRADDVVVSLEPVDTRGALAPVLEEVPRLLDPTVGLLGASPTQLRLKRVADLIGAGLGMIALAPLALILAIGVKLTSRGPVFFKQTRVGKDGEEFTFVKFRSMHNGADDEKDGLLSLNEMSGPIFKMKDDPRITAFGRFLRKTSLDELPQLHHVFKCDMNLVGPRPQLPSEVAEYTPYERQRLLVQPGLTCIWQVSGRSDLEFQTWIEMDLEYIEGWTPRLDAKLILRTFGAVASTRGAY